MKLRTMKMNTRPGLQLFPLDTALSHMTGQRPGGRVITVSEGQWDHLLAGAYEAGWILLELDSDERPVRAYRKRTRPTS